MPSRVGARKGAEAIRNPCPQGFSLLRQFWRKLYRPLNREPYAPRPGGARFARGSFIKETPRAGSAMFGRGGKKTRTRIEPRLDSRAGGAVGGDLRADPADRPPTSSRKKRSAPRDPARARSAADGAGRSSAISSIGASCSRFGAPSSSPGFSPITRASCRRSISSRCPSGRPISPSSPTTARSSPIAATRAGPRSGSSTCRPICPRRSWPSRTGDFTTITASIRSACRARFCATWPAAAA